MTVATALAAIRTQLLTITSPQPPAKVYADPKEATSLGEFPCIILALAPQVEHTWSTEAMGGGSGMAEHNYTAALYVFLGARSTPLNELHARSLGWPEAIFTALVADVTLGGVVTIIGDGESPVLFRYTIGPIAWADGIYWGLKCLLPVTEKPSHIVMGP